MKLIGFPAANNSRAEQNNFVAKVIVYFLHFPLLISLQEMASSDSFEKDCVILDTQANVNTSTEQIKISDEVQIYRAVPNMLIFTNLGPPGV